MERVRNARQHKKQLSLSPIFKNVLPEVKHTHVEFDEIELPKDKFLLLLELQRDIDYLLDAHRKMKD